MTKTLRPLRVLVCGGRDFTDWPYLVKTMNVVSACGRRPVTIIHGGARGADALAGQWAANTKTPYEVYPITPEEWTRLGKGAGAIRNQQMLDTGKPDLVVAFPGGRGTADMVMRAQAAGKRVYIVPKKETEVAIPRCKICRRPLDVPGDVASRDCGGDCLKCMAEIGDPDCQRAMREAGLPFGGDDEYTAYEPPA